MRSLGVRYSNLGRLSIVLISTFQIPDREAVSIPAIFASIRVQGPGRPTAKVVSIEPHVGAIRI